ncbi:MAG TPA: hypothetical protein VNO19_14865 [Gemmatimonadales bacterium]|nr:hypothetical protein [Gemmatimonadales bacterium]
MARALRKTAGVMGAGAGAVALLGLGYAGITWYRYGKVARGGPRDPLVDRFMPKYEVREVHQTRVAAPADVTFLAAHDLDLRRSTIVRAIFTGRELLMGGEHVKREHGPGFLAEILALGWRVLAEEPGRELVIGAVTQPWKTDVQFLGLAPDEFVAFREPGYAKIVWTLAVRPVGENVSIFSTETRVATTDPESRSRFRRYWSVFSPGILLIRYETLRLVRREAERLAALEPTALPEISFAVQQASIAQAPATSAAGPEQPS